VARSADHCELEPWVILTHRGRLPARYLLWRECAALGYYGGMKAGASERVLSTIGLVAFLFEAGCGSGAPVRQPSWTSPRRALDRSSQPSPRIDGHTTAERAPACAAESAETTVRAQIVDRGAALVFTTSDDVGRLRERVSALSVPAFLESAHHRIDRIQDGVRLVFEAEGSQQVAVVQQNVVRHASEMAQSCGLVLGAPTDWNDEQRQRAESSASRPPRRSQEQSPAAALPSRPDIDKPKEKPRASATPNPEATPKPAPLHTPKPADKPKEKPKQNLKPRGGDKPPIPRLPRVPRLPIPRPDPFASVRGTFTLAQLRVSARC
jgi:hypothetical protein